MMKLAEKRLCTGCGLCEQICPAGAVAMIPDALTGFLYPQVCMDICIDCGLCTKNCPELHKNYYPENFEQEVYSAIARSDEIRITSTSGGIFPLLARQILRLGNSAVIGAAYDEQHDLRHMMIQDEKELAKLIRSKYAQSDIRGVFFDIEDSLKKGWNVLFCGTPCQVSAVRNYCVSCENKEKLFLVDLFCRGVPSLKAQKLYLEQIEKEKGSKVISMSSKDKTYGWRSLGTRYDLADGSYFIELAEDCDLARSYIELDYCTRDSCFSCGYKNQERISDISIGDFWGLKESELDDDFGVSAVLINTQKGRNLFDKILEDIRFECRTFQEAAGNGAFVPLRENERERQRFWKLLGNHDYRTAVKLAEYEEIKKTQGTLLYESKRFQKKYLLLYQWMQLKQNHVSLTEFFDKRGISSVAIYGAGELGKLLYNELSHRTGLVKYILDKDAEQIDQESLKIPVYTLADERVHSVDMVVITLVNADEVKTSIQKYFSGQQIVGIGAVLSDLCKNYELNTFL